MAYTMHIDLGEQSAEFARDPKNFPLIVFVHVPKAAGTTVKKFLWLCSHRGNPDCEYNPGPTVLLDYERRCDWLAGHIPKDAFATALQHVGRRIEYFATIREPISQIISHVKWQFEMFHRGPEFYSANDPEARAISEEFRTTDFSCAAAIKTTLAKYPGWFSNIQARFILGSDFATLDDEELQRRLLDYTYICGDQNIGNLFKAFGFLFLPEQLERLRENPSGTYFDERIFETPEMLEFLREFYAHDFRLYKFFHNTAWTANERRPFRPVFKIVTPDNLDERAYLGGNPDVAAALKNHKKWKCGRDHYNAHGHAENRRQLFW